MITKMRFHEICTQSTSDLPYKLDMRNEKHDAVQNKGLMCF